jgi:integrase
LCFKELRYISRLPVGVGIQTGDQMPLPMMRPTKHPRSGTYRLRLAIPAHLRDTTQRLYGCRAELIESLRTKDPREAKKRAPEADARLRAKLAAADAALRGETASLTDRQVASLAGVWFRREVAEHGDNPGSDPQGWRLVLEVLADRTVETGGDPIDGYETTLRLGQGDRDEAAALLVEHGFPPDPEAVERVGRALFDAKVRAAKVLERRAEGDWRPDDDASRFPPEAAVKAAAPPPGAAKEGCTMDLLLAGWAADHGYQVDAKPEPRALYDRRRTMERLSVFLGHRNADAVAKADAVRFKEDAQKRGLTASSIRNDLSELSAVWRWGMANGKLRCDTNPFQGVSPPKPKRRSRAVRPFANGEAATILEAARRERGSLRWLPWVLCLTGARLSEIAQATRADVTAIDGVPVLRITDEGDSEDGEARSVKNTMSRRNVPLHPALIAEGFMDYVHGLPARSPLWPDIPPDRIFGSRGAVAGKRVGRWLRGLGITDQQISPAHSWRHWFIDACRAAQLHPEVRSALTGHSARRDESANYGAGMGSLIQVLAESIAKVHPPLPPFTKAA